MIANSIKSTVSQVRWITALQGLRAVSFLAVFVSHSGLGPFGCLGAWGVSVFLVMSGFLMAYRYMEREAPLGLKFAAKKLDSLYPLHIATMLTKLPIALFNVIGGTLSVATLVVAIVLNIGLVQVWIPWEQMYSALNGPSWFMCVIALAYVLFPSLLKVLQGLKTIRSAFLLLASALTVHLLASLVSFVLMSFGVKEEYVQWITYYFPPVRCCDFVIGCILGWLYLRKQEQEVTRHSTELQAILQVLCVTLIVISMGLYVDGSTLLGSAPVRYSVLFLPTTVILIWLVASCTGPMERFWSLRWMQWVADLSPYAFLIHGVVLKYIRKLFVVLMPVVPGFVVALIALAITLACSKGWKLVASKRKRAL